MNPEKTPSQEFDPFYFQRNFSSQEEAIEFILNFWKAVLPHGNSMLERLLERRNNPDYFREQTFGDRTVLGGTTVTIYYNDSQKPLSEKAQAFLKQQS